MRAKIVGTTLPLLEIELDAGERVIGAPDQLSWMSGNLTLTTSTAVGGGGGGLFGLVSRAVSGAGLFMTEFRAGSGPGLVAFAARLPGTLVEVEVRPDRGYIVHRHGFVCATAGIEISSAFQQTLGGAIFGGEGFFFANLRGPGHVWLQSLPFSRLAGRMLQAAPQRGGSKGEGSIVPNIGGFFAGDDDN